MNHVHACIGMVAAAVLFPAAGFAQKIVFTAEINAAQEVGGTESPARGEAVLHYDMETNTFDLVVNLRKLREPLSDSHIHQAVAGVNGPIVVPIGGEAVYTQHGSHLHLRIEGAPYTGDPAQLLTGGAYLNFHTPTYPAGAARGQLLPHSADFFAILTGDQETPPNASRAWGVALARYDFLDDEIDLFVQIFRFTNTLTNSHIHEEEPGIAGPVVVPLGGADVYRRHGRQNYVGNFENLPYAGDLATLLAGNAYVNIHSNVFPAGEIRGQLILLMPHHLKALLRSHLR